MNIMDNYHKYQLNKKQKLQSRLKYLESLPASMLAYDVVNPFDRNADKLRKRFVEKIEGKIIDVRAVLRMMGEVF